ncbi:histidine phosphatase family protein [Paenibacillus macerans]|uniref:histidine phosphatase family protein n=1 Tax=Paenibacillus macerans TaxID=44252 RepID=UPI003D317739
MKNIYLVRHCKATGQEPEASLTSQGVKESIQLVDFFKDKHIDVIYSSPLLRAIETIRPFANEVGQEVIIEERLKERVLSTIDLDNWMMKLEATYEDLDLSFEGGESSREAMARGISFIEELLNRQEVRNFIVVSHGALLSLMIKHFVNGFGYEEWKRMRNPDIYHLKVWKGEVIVQNVII